MLSTFFVIVYLLIPLNSCSPYWTWKCSNYRCIKKQITSNQEIVTPEVCNLLCNEYSTIWPAPTGKFEITRELSRLSLNLEYQNGNHNDLDLIIARFIQNIKTNNHLQNTTIPHKNNVKVQFHIKDQSPIRLSLDSDESYKLRVYTPYYEDNKIIIAVNATNYLGVRHALETLSQVIIYDTIGQSYVMPSGLLVHDAPKYPIRGIMLDTARNYINVNIIKRVIEGMAQNKLNTFHWHLTDSQSFPFLSKSLPELTYMGRYSTEEVYTHQMVHDVVEFARIRGVRVLPEFDSPAHVGEGWQKTDLVVCFNKKPWYLYCKEPPCGQFDPTNDKLYKALKLLFRDFVDAFDPDLFHFGGDEVNYNCWKSIQWIETWMHMKQMPVNETGFTKLWSYYQDRIYKIFMHNRNFTIPAVLWSGILTHLNNLHYIPPDKYIIQLWTKKGSKTIKNLIKNNYKIIFSNYDALYLDCGYSSWTAKGTNWCAPFIGWKEIYENSPRQIVSSFTNDKSKQKLIMGAIAPLWTETVDSSSVEGKIWPRGCALAERVWSEPETGWEEVESRLDTQRLRMQRLGLQVDAIGPRWCHLNQDSCQDWNEKLTNDGNRFSLSLL